MEKELTIGELHHLYQKYGDLNLKIETPYGFKDIEWCGITEENADIYKCELEDGKYIEGADYHKLKKEDGEFINLKEIKVGIPVQTIDGISKIKSIELMNFKDTLYDVQVAEVHQYYTNGIISHNSTLTIDALKFLLYGTTTKTDKNEEIFNQFSNKNEMIVRGLIEIGGEELIVERKMKRTAKKDGGWNVTNKVNYYEILPDGEEKSQSDEDAKKTTVKLKSTIGNEKDFEMLVLATESNLDDLIGLTTTESGKILTRLIGLEIIEKKEEAARTMYNNFNKNKKSINLNVITLGQEIDEHNTKIKLGESLETETDTKLLNIRDEIINLQAENDRLLNTKIKVDVEIITLNPSKLQEEVDKITNEGKALVTTKSGIETKIAEIGEVKFDEDTYHKITKEINHYKTEKAIKESEIKNLKQSIQDLIDGGICKACNRKLDNVDNSQHISNHEINIREKEHNIIVLEDRIKEHELELSKIETNKILIDEKNKLELARDRAEVEIGALRNTIVSKKNDLKKYKLNENAIEINRKIDGEVTMVKTKLAVSNFSKDETISKLEKIKQDIANNKAEVLKKTKLIEQIKKEDEIEKIYKIYIDLVGKKGISKLVLRSVLPIINSEVQRLLEDVTDFEIEIFIDDKNDVQFLLNKDGVSKPLKSGSGFEKTASSLALRGVLGKLSTLPMPNFISFDEVLGKVANENLDKLKPLFDKIKNMYEILFLITHNDIVKDWSDNLITVIKTNNISKVTYK